MAHPPQTGGSLLAEKSVLSDAFVVTDERHLVKYEKIPNTCSSKSVSETYSRGFGHLFRGRLTIQLLKGSGPVIRLPDS